MSLSTADCGKAFTEGGSALFTYEGDRLGMEISRKATASPTKNTCGEDPQTGLTLDFEDAWPTIPSSRRARCRSRAPFGNAHAFKVEMRVSDTNSPPRQSASRQVSAGSLAGTRTETPTYKATVRFIRLSHG